jgi:hypothetical protein
MIKRRNKERGGWEGSDGWQGREVLISHSIIQKGFG